MTIETLPLSSMNQEELGLFWGGDARQASGDPELELLQLAINRLCPDDLPMTVLFAVPNVHHDPDFPEQVRPPLAVIESGSPLLKVFYALATSGRIAFVSTVLNTSKPDSEIALRRAPQAHLIEGLAQKQPIFLKQGVLVSCVALLTDAPASSVKTAAMAALITAWPSAYSYWSSFGRMLSSMDVIQALRAGQSRTYLITGSETVWVRWNPQRNAEIVGDVALEHAIAMQRYAHLPETEMIKLALFSLAKTLGITVCCSSLRADALSTVYREVWPPREPFIWAMELVHQV